MKQRICLRDCDSDPAHWYSWTTLTGCIVLRRHKGDPIWAANLFQYGLSNFLYFLFFVLLFSFDSANSPRLQCWLAIHWTDIKCMTKRESLLVENQTNSRPSLLELHTPGDWSHFATLSPLPSNNSIISQFNIKISRYISICPTVAQENRSEAWEPTVNILRRGWEFFSVAFLWILGNPATWTTTIRIDWGTNNEWHRHAGNWCELVNRIDDPDM